MGRTRTKSKKIVPTAFEISTEKRPDPSIESLLAKAYDLVAQCDYDLSQKFINRILQRSPGHAQAIELLGVTQLEKGDLDEALQTFTTLIPPSNIAPNPPPPSAYLYLAQLSENDPHRALEYYQAAVTILFGQLKGKEPEAVVRSSDEGDGDVKKNIVRALIAMVELWMAPTYDLCFEPKAEENCESLLKTAFEMDPDNIEALICKSSLRLSQQRPDEARNLALKAWSAWKDLEPDDPIVPSIQTRLELTKRLIEISEYDASLLILQGIMSTDDQEVEVWYLEGWCYYLMAEQAKESGEKVDDLEWTELARDARDCLESCQLLHVNQGHPDNQLLEHTKEIIDQLDELGIQPSPEEEEDDFEDDTFEGISDDDVDVEMR